MDSILKMYVKKPFFHLKNNIIIKINKQFAELTGFTEEEILGKSISELNNILRITSQVPLEYLPKDFTCYIFTKTFKVKEVIIHCKVLDFQNESIYYLKVKSKLPFEDSFPYIKYLLKDNKFGVAIYSAVDLVLLTANQKFLDLQTFPHNYIGNNIGRKLKDRLNGFDSKKGEYICNETIKTGKAYYDEEFEHVTISNGITYWDRSVIPVSIDGKIKYLFETVTEVTERVLYRKIIEEQNKEIEEQKDLISKQKKELEAIIENISDGISIIDHKGQHKLFNKNARNMFSPPKEFPGNIHTWYKESELSYFNGDKIPPEDYPESRILRGENFTKMKVSAKYPNKLVHLDVSGTPIYDDDGKFLLGVICNRDVTDYCKQEEVLKSKNEFLDRLIDKLELPVIRISSADLRVLELNQKAFDIMQRFRPTIKSSLEIKGNLIVDIFPTFKEQEYLNKLNEVIQEKKIKYINKKAHIVNGNEIYWNVILEPVFQSNGEVQEILVLIIDITTEIRSNKTMEKALKSQE